MNRRNFVGGSAALMALALEGRAISSALAQEMPGADSVPFSGEWLLDQARRLAQEDYQAPSADLPGEFADMGYDLYRDIRLKPEARVWANEPLQFEIDFFHRGFIFDDPVKIWIVDGGQARRMRFSPDLFTYGVNLQPPAADPELDFSGFRIRSHINTPDVWDEFLVFQGASYFRAVGRNQLYGLSARGLAINTGSPEGEEFPAFRQFWIERPSPDSLTLVVHALLDSPSATGAYRFAASPGVDTVIEVNGAIFPRQPIEKIGLAPLTSMFVFDATNHGGFDDFRSAVHDSNGLQMLSGAGEWIWRPLANPTDLQISMFVDDQPRGFGLMQRARSYEDYSDLEAGYERRPSLWIEPLGNWGSGFVELVEIPTQSEIHDNIVAYWRPNGTVPAGGPWPFSYRMHWTDTVQPQGLMVTTSSRMGLSLNRKKRQFVIDFRAVDGIGPEALRGELNASTGTASNLVVHERVVDETIRVTFELEPDGDNASELRLRLFAGDKTVSETWLYKWTPR
jgi:glucans biosynthesis protein